MVSVGVFRVCCPIVLGYRIICAGSFSFQLQYGTDNGVHIVAVCGLTVKIVEIVYAEIPHFNGFAAAACLAVIHVKGDGVIGIGLQFQVTVIGEQIILVTGNHRIIVHFKGGIVDLRSVIIFVVGIIAARSVSHLISVRSGVRYLHFQILVRGIGSNAANLHVLICVLHKQVVSGILLGSVLIHKFYIPHNAARIIGGVFRIIGAGNFHDRFNFTVRESFIRIHVSKVNAAYHILTCIDKRTGRIPIGVIGILAADIGIICVIVADNGSGNPCCVIGTHNVQRRLSVGGKLIRQVNIAVRNGAVICMPAQNAALNIGTITRTVTALCPPSVDIIIVQVDYNAVHCEIAGKTSYHS